MALVYKDRVKQTCPAPTGSAAFVFTTTDAVSGYQQFVDAYAEGETLIYAAEDAASPPNWEVGIGTWTESGESLARTTILSSSNAGSAESFTGTVTVYVTADALAMQRQSLMKGTITGGILAYSSTTAITVSECRLSINNKTLSTSGTTTLTSGSTMVNLAGSTVTLGASKAYFVFAYDNAGTLEFRVEERDGTGDGADPTWDIDFDYWKAASTGAAARRIGKFWTNASSQVLNFTQYGKGRTRIFQTIGYAVVVLVNGGTSTSYASITLTPYITADDDEIILQATVITGAAGSDYIYLSLDSGTTDSLQAGSSADTGITSLTSRMLLQNTGTLHYKVNTSDTGYVRACGFKEYV